MEAHDFLADHLQVGWPIFLEFLLIGLIRRSKTDRRNVIRQCIQPNIDHVFRIIRHEDAPGKRTPADGKVTQAASYK